MVTARAASLKEAFEMAVLGRRDMRRDQFLYTTVRAVRP